MLRGIFLDGEVSDRIECWRIIGAGDVDGVGDGGGIAVVCCVEREGIGADSPSAKLLSPRVWCVGVAPVEVLRRGAVASVETPSVVEPPVMAKASMSPSASEAESVPERFDVVVSEELAVSAIEPAAAL